MTDRAWTDQPSGAVFPRPSDDLLKAIAVAGPTSCAMVLWLVSLPTMDPDAMTDIGLVAILPWTFWAAIALLPAGFAAGLYLYPHNRAVHAAGLVALVVVLHATPAIVYDTLRYSWAWKHIGIVDYIQRHGGVDRTIPFMPAYHNWPGFFWVSAVLANFFDLNSVQIAKLVRFFPVLSNLVFLPLLGALFMRFTTDRRLIYAALWIFVCSNWVGQDYFSPQTFAYILYLAVLTLCLGPLMPRIHYTSRSRRRLNRWRAKVSDGVILNAPLSRTVQISAFVLALACMAAMMATHQLTPIILIIALAGISIVSPLSPGYAIIAALMFLFWIMVPAAPFVTANLSGELDRLGQTVSGVTDRLVDTRNVTLGTATVVWVGRALSAAVGIIGILGWLRQYRLGARDGILSVLLIAPTLILAVTSYGGEAIFRIYFFCLPFLAYFCAAAFFPHSQFGRGRRTYVAFAALMILFSAGFLFANNGKDRQYRFSQEEVDAAVWLYSHNTPDTLLIEMARNYPSQFMNYENFYYLPLAAERSEDRAEIFADPAATFSNWFSDTKWKDGYVVVTRGQLAYLDVSGILPLEQQDSVIADLNASPDLVLVFENRDARVFRARRFITP